MTHIVRYETTAQTRVGVLDDGAVRRVPGVESMAALLAMSLAEARTAVDGAAGGTRCP